MEALSVKLGIFASLFGVLGLLGLAVLLASVIWLVIRVANWDSVLPALLGVLLSVAMVAGGLILSPAPDYRPEPLKMPWETLLDWVGSLRDGKAEDEEPSENGETTPENEAAAAPESESGEPAAPENGEPTPPEDSEPEEIESIDVAGAPDQG